jgi:Fe-S oxidoreductase
MSNSDLRKQFSACQRCNYCRWVPVPKSHEFAYICPSIQYGKNFGYTGGGKMITGYGLVDGAIGYSPQVIDSVYACSACGGCDVGCKTNFADLVEPMNAIYEVRRRFVQDGQLPDGLRALLKNLEQYGNADGRPSEERAAWAEGLNLPLIGTKPIQTLLHLGEVAFERSQWPALRRVVDELRAAGEVFAFAGDAEPDSGALAFDIGDWPLAESFAKRTVELFRTSGARRVLTLSDSAFMAFRSIYPRLGVPIGDVEVMHITQWLAGSAQAAPKPKQPVSAKVTYHDACRLGRLSEPYVPWKGQWLKRLNSLPMRTDITPVRFGTEGVYEEPRALLRAAGAELVEMERTREFAYCCGAGGGAAQANPDFAKQAGLTRLKEAVQTGAPIMVTSCAGCAAHMNRLAVEAELPIRVMTVLDYLQRGTSALAQRKATAKSPNDSDDGALS